jgi:hypothetical protein
MPRLRTLGRMSETSGGRLPKRMLALLDIELVERDEFEFHVVLLVSAGPVFVQVRGTGFRDCGETARRAPFPPSPGGRAGRSAKSESRCRSRGAAAPRPKGSTRPCAPMRRPVDSGKASNPQVALDAQTEGQAQRSISEREPAKLGTAEAEVGEPEQRVAILGQFARQPCRGGERVEQLDQRALVGARRYDIARGAPRASSGVSRLMPPPPSPAPRRISASSQSAALLARLAARKIARLSARSTASHDAEIVGMAHARHDPERSAQERRGPSRRPAPRAHSPCCRTRWTGRARAASVAGPVGQLVQRGAVIIDLIEEGGLRRHPHIVVRPAHKSLGPADPEVGAARRDHASATGTISRGAAARARRASARAGRRTARR